MDPFVLPLDRIRDSDREQVGAKALRLAQLRRAGLPVPPGFCVTRAAVEQLSSVGGEGGPRATPAGDWPAEVVAALQAGCRALGWDPAGSGLSLAVRSSATAEDLPSASFAGQYSTELNVLVASELTPLLEAVLRCVASAGNDHAQAYAEHHGVDLHGVGMAVLVQEQVPAQAAGVLFTLNPLTGREEEMLVEAAWGLGEPLVAGEVTPHRFVVDPYRRRVLRREPVEQHMMRVVAQGGGTSDVPVPPERAASTVLTDDQLLELAELGYRVQALYGYPQDVEWALVDGRFFLLQTRPLTAFQFDPQMGQWTSANHREVLPGFASPLSLSLSLEIEYGRALAQMFRDLKMGEAPPDTVWGRPFFGRAYWNVGVVKQFASRIPGFKERTFDATVGIEPTYEGDGLTTPWTPRTIARALPVLFALERRYETCWQEAADFAARFLRDEEPEIARVDPGALSDVELEDWVRRIVDLHLRTNHVAITVSLLAAQAQDEFAPVLERLNRGCAPEEAIHFSDLIAGLGEEDARPGGAGPDRRVGLVWTAQPTLELWTLAREAAADPRLATAVTEGPAEGIPVRLQATSVGRAFWGKVAAFIQKYRYLGRVDEDLAEPRWDEDPTFVLSTLQGYVRAVCEGADPEPLMAEQRERAERARKRAMTLLSRGWRRLWPFARRSFANQLERVRRYVWWREEMRVVASMAFYHCRRFFLELGKRWAERGWLREAGEIFLVRWHEIDAALRGEIGPQEIRAAIDRYLRLRAAYRNFEPPNVIGRGARMSASEPRGRICLRGTPCSTGRATGPARVVRGLEEARALQEGEILVAPYTNPGWVPLFNLAAGLVIEAGGLLSHGAVVAREYGIPAVIGAEGATRLLRTGQRVVVDGAAGTVEVLE